jgi:hypothetical protein
MTPTEGAEPCSRYAGRRCDSLSISPLGGLWEFRKDGRCAHVPPWTARFTKYRIHEAKPVPKHPQLTEAGPRWALPMNGRSTHLLSLGG